MKKVLAVLFAILTCGVGFWLFALPLYRVRIKHTPNETIQKR